jgi:hypothetical protein
MFAPWRNARQYTRLHTTEHEDEMMIALLAQRIYPFCPILGKIAATPQNRVD